MRINVVWLLFFSWLLPFPVGHTEQETSEATVPAAPQWQQIELEFTAERRFDNAYLECEAWVDFVHEDGTEIRRPMFWDGDETFRVRFASTKDNGV